MFYDISSVNKHFEAGAETVTLSKAEWTAILEITRSYAATGGQLRKAERETERVKRIARPLWQACRRVSRQIRRSAGSPSLHDLQAWEITLRHALDVDWHDLPPEQRTREAAARYR